MLHIPVFHSDFVFPQSLNLKTAAVDLPSEIHRACFFVFYVENMLQMHLSYLTSKDGSFLGGKCDAGGTVTLAPGAVRRLPKLPGDRDDSWHYTYKPSGAERDGAEFRCSLQSVKNATSSIPPTQ